MNKKLLSLLGPGECFGEMAYLSLSSHERGASVTASRESRIVRISVPDLERDSERFGQSSASIIRKPFSTKDIALFTRRVLDQREAA